VPDPQTLEVAAMMVRTLALLAVSLLSSADPPGAVPSREQVLKLFVEELVPLTPGQGKFPASFTLGSRDKDAPATEKPAVPITLKHPFAISRYEVTQELYQHIMGNNPSKWKGRRNSVEMVNWEEANTFCQKLTTELRKLKLIGDIEVIRLPSEAEWEYACRAGTTSAWSFGDKEDELGAHAWYNKNSKGYDPPVGQKKPNPWGLYDMHGYVWEWCSDAWSPTHEGADAGGSPRGGRDVKERVVRGGSWGDSAAASRSSFREGKPADTRSDRIGLRCVKAKEGQ
jgi:formylglycine-generating enzyme required for sulfatase activity